MAKAITTLQVDVTLAEIAAKFASVAWAYKGNEWVDNETIRLFYQENPNYQERIGG